MSTKVDWKHLFPESWEFLPAKRLFPESKERAHPDDTQLTASQDWGVIPQEEFIRRAGRRVVQINQHLDKRKRVECNDFVISMRSFQGGLERAWASGGIRSSYVVLKPSAQAEVGYFSRLFKCEQYVQALQATAHFIRDGQDLNYQNFCLVDLPLPSQDEQTQIAKFLDYETAKIDALIEKQQQLITLLKEKRQAVISHAVTQGLDPDVPMRDSGVEWLGEVPAHWEVSKFGFVSSVVRGGSPRPAGDPTLFDGDYSPWVTVAEITKDDEIMLAETATCLTKKGSIQCRVFKAGTLLLSNSGATLGVPKVLMIDANANDGVVGFENLQHQREYCYHYLSSLTEDLRERIKQGSGQPNLNTDIVKALPVLIPPPDEVDIIVRHIAKQREKLKLLTEKAELGIELLQERRTALISAAVTGKFDVRGWEPPESETEEEAA